MLSEYSSPESSEENSDHDLFVPPKPPKIKPIADDEEYEYLDGVIAA